MPIGLDHTILEVHDLTESLSFYRDVVGLEYKGKDGPFDDSPSAPDGGMPTNWKPRRGRNWFGPCATVTF